MELIWWVFTAVVAAAVLFPIWDSAEQYPFWAINIAYIIAAVTLTRYIFLTQFTFLAERKILKLLLIIAAIPVIFTFINHLVDFQTYLDEIGLETILQKLPSSEQESMFNYIRNQMIFFGTTAIIASIIFPVKMLVSIWRNFNR